MTQWRKIPGYEDLYEISDTGEVRSCVSGRTLSQRWHLRVGHWRVKLWAENKGRTFLISRLVLLAFRGVAPVKAWTASHLNGDARDNRLENLAWESMRDNHARRDGHGTMLRGEDAPWSKLTEKQVQEIRASTEAQTVLGERYGVHQSQVSRVRTGSRWKHLN